MYTYTNFCTYRLAIQLPFGKWHGLTLNSAPSWHLVPMMAVFLFLRNKTVPGRKFMKATNTLLQVKYEKKIQQWLGCIIKKARKF